MTNAASLLKLIGGVFLVMYFFLTLVPDIPLLKHYTKPDDDGCVSTKNCFTIAAIIAAISPILFVIIKSLFKKSAAKQPPA